MDKIQNYDEDIMPDDIAPTSKPRVIGELALNDVEITRDNDQDTISVIDDDEDVDDEDVDEDDDINAKRNNIVLEDDFDDEDEDNSNETEDEFNENYEKLTSEKIKIVEIEFDKRKHIQQLTLNEMTRIIININDMINNNVLQLSPTDNKVDFIYDIIVQDKFDIIIRRPIDLLTVVRVRLSQLKINKTKLKQKLMRLF